MPFYLSEYIGAGTRQDPFVPVTDGSDDWHAIDLRASGLNACLLRTTNPFTDARARFLADDKLEALTNPQKNFLTNRLGVDLSSPTLLRDIIATILTNPPANGWKPLTPGFLKWEIYLGELIWEAPRASGGATDDFNRADAALTTPWVKPTWSATASVSGNGLVASGDAGYYYSGSVSGANQYAQLTVPLGAGSRGGPAVRLLAVGGASLYMCDNFSNVTTGECAKFVGGLANYTLIGLTGTTRANPIRIEAEGSTIRIYYNGVQVANSPWTDTSVPDANDGAGFWYYDGTNAADNWSGGDLAPATADKYMIAPPMFV